MLFYDAKLPEDLVGGGTTSHSKKSIIIGSFAQVLLRYAVKLSFLSFGHWDGDRGLLHSRRRISEYPPEIVHRMHPVPAPLVLAVTEPMYLSVFYKIQNLVVVNLDANMPAKHTAEPFTFDIPIAFRRF
jgi:hypothetical protein